MTDKTSDRPFLPAALVNVLIKVEMPRQLCWNVSRVLGSMLVFDFGSRRTEDMSRGRAVDVGESQLSVRNCFWTLSAPQIGRINSDVLDDDKMVRLKPCIEGLALTGCRQRRGRLYLEFGGGVTLGIDLTNRYDVDDNEQIAEIRSAMGHNIGLLASGVFTLKVPEHIEVSQAAA